MIDCLLKKLLRKESLLPVPSHNYFFVHESFAALHTTWNKVREKAARNFSKVDLPDHLVPTTFIFEDEIASCAGPVFIKFSRRKATANNIRLIKVIVAGHLSRRSIQSR